MKKRVKSAFCSLFVLCSVVLSASMCVSAEETNSNSTGAIIDGSLLTHEDSAKGIASNPMLRGKHLMDGESAISKAGNGRIYVYGQTTANHDVDFVAVLMYVEQYYEETGKWRQIADYTGDARNTYYVIVDDTLRVDRGYYYRVRCEHMAGNDDEDDYDEAFSVTNGIWIP